MINDQTPSHLRTAAEILVEMSEEIERLGAGLCCDPAVITHHVAALQGIDLMAQKQRWLASVLRAECQDTEVGRISVESLRERFSSAPH